MVCSSARKFLFGVASLGKGKFTLKLWTERPKLDKQLWAGHIGAGVKRAASGKTIWHDNEKFLKQPQVYANHSLTMKCFPPNSGDLNPIETVWAWLRTELARREMSDLDMGKTISAQQFRQRASQILHSYAVADADTGTSYLQRLVAGMPRRPKRMWDNDWGSCGK